MSDDTITKIAIVGAGIGGLATAISLRRLPNVDVQIFEQAQALREVGASIALGPNGLRGLEEMGAINALSEDIAFRSDHGYPMVYKHWKTGEELVRDEHSPAVTQRIHHTARYYRPHLQQALADNIPSDTIHLNKRLTKLEVNSDGVLLTFQDGSSYPADLVIGADGINSKVRSSYLPNYKLKPTGQIALRAVFDISPYIEDLLTENPELRNSVHVTGPDKNFFSSQLGKGKFTVVGLGYPDDETSPWKGMKWDDEVVDVQRFRDGFKTWHPSISTLTNLIPPTTTSSLHIYPTSSSNQIPPPTHFGRIVLIGDSFHPHGGLLAAGGSLAIDDAVALFLCLGYVLDFESGEEFTVMEELTATEELECFEDTGKKTNRNRFSHENLSRALTLYAATRLPHVERVFDAVERMRGGGHGGAETQGAESDTETDTDTRTTKMVCDEDEEEAKIEEKIRNWVKNKKEVVWLHEHDVHRAFEDAIRGGVVGGGV